MKSEERHRLQHNDLERVVASTASSLERFSTTIVAVICGVLLVIAAVVWWGRQSSATSSEAWTLLERAQNVEDFSDIADKNKNTLVGYWAKLRESEAYLGTGSNVLFGDRELANADLKRAREGFELLLATPNIDAVIRERAVWGLALVLEATSDEDTTRAIEAYQRLVNDYPQSIYKPFADERIATLKTGAAKEFYAWFSKQSPKPADIRPKDGALKNGLDQLLPSPGATQDVQPKKESTDASGNSQVGDVKNEGESKDATQKGEAVKTDASSTSESKPEKQSENKSTDEEKKP